MQYSAAKLNELFDKWRKGDCSPRELEDLYMLLTHEAADDTLKEATKLIWQQLPAFPVDKSVDAFQLADKILKANPVNTEPVTPVRRLHFIRRWGWAAAALVLVATGAYFWTAHKRNPDLVAERSKKVDAVDVEPGRNGALLTLADGSIIVLDSLNNGVVATQNGATVMLHNGQLAYHKDNATGEITFNTITTPNGRQFQVILPDGTKVWLNAASSLRYPTVFAGAERKVKITGEAYFEVARNTESPFRVIINDEAEIEVVGTHFNVNAYADNERINATLLEGAVRISYQGNTRLLKPAQQATLTPEDGLLVKKDVNVSQVIAWKEGVFNFDQMGVKAVMRQLSRWYNVDVLYEGAVPDIIFGGEIGRNLSLMQVLEGLQAAGLRFRLEKEKRLVILPSAGKR